VQDRLWPGNADDEAGLVVLRHGVRGRTADAHLVVLAAGVVRAVAEGQSVQPGRDLLFAVCDGLAVSQQLKPDRLGSGRLHPGVDQETFVNAHGTGGIDAGDGKVTR
jgi:hypothetical protein